MDATFSISNIYVGGNTSPKTQPKHPIAPFINKLPAGTYKSEIMSISSIAGRDKALTVVHTLTDAMSKTYLVRFNYYNENIDRFIDSLANSGYVGGLVDIVGYKETVEIEHGRTYAYIAYREKINENSSENNSLEDSSKETLSKVEAETTQEDTKERRRGGLTAYRRRSVETRTPKAKNLLKDDEDEDDEFDDFLENDE